VTSSHPEGVSVRSLYVTPFEMRDMLREEGIDLRRGPEDMDAARDEIDAARNLE